MICLRDEHHILPQPILPSLRSSPFVSLPALQLPSSPFPLLFLLLFFHQFSSTTVFVRRLNFNPASWTPQLFKRHLFLAVFFFFLPPLTLFSREYSSVLLIWKLFHARILKHLSRIFDYLSTSFFLFSFFFIKSMLLRVNSFVVHFFAPLETVYKRNTVHLVISRGGERIKLTISLLFSPWNIPFTI